MNIAIALLIFGIIIAVHELGHFILAKVNKIFVTEFSLGFGPRLFSFVPTSDGYKFKVLLKGKNIEDTPQWQVNTIYSLKLIPFGGSCAMLGEDESHEDDRAFNKKSPLARISVVFAGAFFNFILAFILSMVIVGALGYDPANITKVNLNSAAAKAGLEEGDLITKINGKNISLSKEVNTYFLLNPIENDKPIKITYERDGDKYTTNLTPLFEKTYMLGFAYDNDKLPASIKSIHEDFPIHKAGLMVGDIITKFNGTLIESGEELAVLFAEKKLNEEPVEITFVRDGKEDTKVIKPQLYQDGYDIGFVSNPDYKKANPLEILKYGAIEVKYNIVTTLDSFKVLLAGKIGFDNLAGPVGIVNIIGDTYEASKPSGGLITFLTLANITIMISANVGVINLLPLPALDGGRLVFLIIELIRKKPVPPEKEGMVHFVGFVALMILAILVLFNDFSRLL